MQHKVDTSGRPSSIHADDITITLSQAGENKVNYQGTSFGTLDVETDSLSLKACGQDGTDGQIGATGEPGYNGMDGQDATQFSIATNGSHGGKGGHGGRGTSGTDSGNGGNITVTVANEDRAFLDLIDAVDLSPGKPGAAGRHGEGGAGGRGGRGGRSYSWTTTSTYETTETYQDGQGDTHIRPVTQTQYHHHTNPGGMDGAQGPRGDKYTDWLKSGKSGSRGQYQIVLTDASHGQTKHSSKYSLSLSSPYFVAQSGSDILEPGDKVDAFYKVKNGSMSMASPPEKVEIKIGYSSHGIMPVRAGEVAGNIPARGQSDNNEAPAVFQIDVPRAAKRYEPYRQQISVHTNPINTRINRFYPNATNNHTVEVKFPVAFKKHKSNYSIARDENVTIPAGIHNISNRAIGDVHQRSLSIDLRDDKGNVIDEYVIQSLNGKSTDDGFGHFFEFSPNAKFGESKTFERNLYLQVLGSTEKTCIESQLINVQLTPKYQAPQSGFTLVIDENTSEALLAHWSQKLNILAGGKGVAIWNTSYYQKFPMQEQLLPEVGHGSVVVLGNSLNYKPYSPYGSAIFVNSSQAMQKPQSKGALFKDKTPLSHTTIEKLVEYLQKEPQEPFLLPEKSLTENRQYHHQVTIKSKYWFYPTPADEEAQHLQAHLNQVFPLRDYKVTVNTANAQTDTIVLDVIRQHPVLHKANTNIMLDSSYIATHNPEMMAFPKHSVVDGLSFIQALSCFANEKNEFHQMLAKKITSDLLDEQALLTTKMPFQSWFARLFKKDMFDYQNELQRLNQWVNTLKDSALYDAPNRGIEHMDMIIKICAAIQYQAKQRVSFWDKLLHFFTAQSNIEMLNVTTQQCQEALNAYQQKLGGNVVSLQEACDERQKKMALQTKLEQFIEDKTNHTPWTCCGLFKPPFSNTQLIKAAQSLNRVLEDETPMSEVQKHMVVLESKELQALYQEFQSFYSVEPLTVQPLSA